MFLGREIGQLEPALEGLQVAPAEAEGRPPDNARGGALRVVGEDVSALIDTIAAQLKVIGIARVKKPCRRCERMVEEPAPSRPIPRGMAGPNLLASVPTPRFDDRVPLFRQNEIVARRGADIPDTTPVDRCGGAMKALAPPIEKIAAEILSGDLLHADDTPIRVPPLPQGQGAGQGCQAGPIANIPESPAQGAAVFCTPLPVPASRNPPSAARTAPRRSERLRARRLCVAGAIVLGPMTEHGALHDVWTSTRSEIAKEALDRIAKLCDTKRQIVGQPAEVRRAVRQERSKPEVEAFRAWAEPHLTRSPGKSDLARAFRCGLGRWDSFCLFLGEYPKLCVSEPAHAVFRDGQASRRPAKIMAG